MSIIKSDEEIKNLKEGGKRLAFILRKLEEAIKPGISTKELDQMAFNLVRERDDKPAFLNYQPDGAKKPFPASLCVSVNHEVVHGIPDEQKILKEGDIITIDMGLIHKGLITDSARTVAVGTVDKQDKLLIQATKECLNAGISSAKVGSSIGDIGAAVEKVAKKYDFSIAEGLAGHGVGHKVHEDPLVPNTGKKGSGQKLKAGMVLAIEPMLCIGSGEICLEKDGFTLSTKDKKRSAHFEHTVVVTERGPFVLTT